MVSIRTFALCSVVLLGACGQTGPLVLPSEVAGTEANEVDRSTNIATPADESQQTNTDTETTLSAE